MLVSPGFGVVGVGGLGLTLYGLYLLLLPDVPVSDEITKRQTPEKFLQVSTAIGGTMCNLFYLLMLVSQIFTPTEKKQTPMNTKRRNSDEIEPNDITPLRAEDSQDSAGTALLESDQRGFHI